MLYTENDYNEAEVVASLMKTIDEMDEKYFHQISDEIYKHQPFFLTVLLGYRQDTSLDELSEIMNIWFLVWEYFNNNNIILKVKVTKVEFENVQTKNFQMLKYSEGEQTPEAMSLVFTDDLQNLKSKALLGAVVLKILENPLLANLDLQLKATILFDLKSFIECFESII